MVGKLNLKQKLVAVRKSIGILQKTEAGNQGARYVDPAVILLKIREAMDLHSVLLTIQISESKNTQVPAPTTKNPNNLDFLSENTMDYTWHDAETDETLSCKWLAVGSHMQDPSMAFGGALTYSERYFLLKFFQVPTTKDDPEFLKGKAGVIECVSADQVANIRSLIAETKTDINLFLKHFNIGDISEVHSDSYNHVVGMLEAKK